MLKIHELDTGFKNRMVVRNVSFSVEPGQLVAIKGRNGTGKTTLLRTIAGLNRPHAGTVTIDGLDLFSMSPKQRAGKISMVMTGRQSPALDVLTVVSMGRYAQASAFGWISSADLESARECLFKLGIPHLEKSMLNTLSDGEMQKVMIACAINQKSNFLLLDEPTAFLDYVARDEIFLLMKGIVSKENIGILFSSHDMELIHRHASRVLELKDGLLTEITIQ